jgi:fucose permease
LSPSNVSKLDLSGIAKLIKTHRLSKVKTMLLTISAFLSLAMVGFFHTILGTALPAMRLSFAMDMAQAGLLGSTVWLGFTAAVFAGGTLSDFFPRHRILMLACLMIGLSAIFFGMWHPFGLNCFFIGVLGAGTGVIVSSSSALVMELHPQKEGVIMNVHHFFYAIGAITGPLLMGYVLDRGGHWQWIYRIGGTWMLIVSGSFALQRIRFKREKSSLGHRSLFHLLKEKNLILLILITIFGVGAQNGLYLWLVSFLKEAQSFPIFQASIGLSLFSIGVAVGRLVSGGLAVKIKNTRVLLILLGSLNIVLILFMCVSHHHLILLLCLSAGLACSGLFPVTLTLGGINYPQRAGTTIGIIGTAAGIGGTLVSWLISFVSQKIALEAGFFITLSAAAFIALVLVAIYYKRLKKSETKQDMA